MLCWINVTISTLYNANCVTQTEQRMSARALWLTGKSETGEFISTSNL